MIDHKLLKKLANECRKNGIKSFKCADFEFTLTDEKPISNYKRKVAAKPAKTQEIPPFSFDEQDEWSKLSLEQQISWSSSLASEVATDENN